jgi:hypothetical protein
MNLDEHVWVVCIAKVVEEEVVEEEEINEEEINEE